MSVPSYDEIIYPMLKLAEDGNEYYINDEISIIADFMDLSKDVRNIMHNQKQTKFTYRAAWAKTYLTKSKLLDMTGRGRYKITDRGKHVLTQGIKKIDKDFLMQFPEFVEFAAPNRKNNNTETDEDLSSQSKMAPIEQLENAYTTINNTLVSDLQDQISSCSPAFFEQLVVDVLVGIGYGGSIEDAGQAIGRSVDEGIDGVTKEDVLGMEEIYIQAKRWEAKIGRPEIQKFAGALLGKKARKGVFITTSDFTDNATEYAEKLEHKVVLINGRKLAELMVKYCIGVSTKDAYEIKEIDSDYFVE